MKEIINQRKYRCRVTTPDSELFTDIITVRLKEDLSITIEPEDVEAAVGESVRLHVEANRADAAFQWQYSTTNGSSWRNCTSNGCKTNTFSFLMKEIINQRKYRCHVTTSDSELYTSAISVRLKEGLIITVEPEDVEAAVGESVRLHVEANRVDAAFQWQYSTTNGSSWRNCTSNGCKMHFAPPNGHRCVCRRTFGGVSGH